MQIFKTAHEFALTLCLFASISILSFLAIPVFSQPAISLDLEQIHSECSYQNRDDNLWTCRFDLKPLGEETNYKINEREEIYLYQELSSEAVYPCTIEGSGNQLLVCSDISGADAKDDNQLILAIGFRSEGRFVEVGCTQLVSFVGDDGDFIRRPNPISTCSVGNITQEGEIPTESPTSEPAEESNDEEVVAPALAEPNDGQNTLELSESTTTEETLTENESNIQNSQWRSSIFIALAVTGIIGSISFILTCALLITKKKSWKASAFTCGVSVCLIIVCMVGYTMTSV